MSLVSIVAIKGGASENLVPNEHALYSELILLMIILNDLHWLNINAVVFDPSIW